MPLRTVQIDGLVSLLYRLINRRKELSYVVGHYTHIDHPLAIKLLAMKLGAKKRTPFVLQASADVINLGPADMPICSASVHER